MLALFKNFQINLGTIVTDRLGCGSLESAMSQKAVNQKRRDAFMAETARPFLVRYRISFFPEQDDRDGLIETKQIEFGERAWKLERSL